MVDKQNILQSKIFKDFLFYAMIVVIIILAVYLIIHVRNDSIKCMASPLTYGVSKISSTGNMPIECYCSSQDSNQVIYFNKDNITYAPKGYFP